MFQSNWFTDYEFLVALTEFGSLCVWSNIDGVMTNLKQFEWIISWQFVQIDPNRQKNKKLTIEYKQKSQDQVLVLTIKFDSRRTRVEIMSSFALTEMRDTWGY